MKKWMLCLSVFLIAAMPFKTTLADDVKSFADEASVQAYIGSVYRSIDFRDNEHLSFDVFARAYKGYLNLRNAGKMDLSKEVLTVCDFELPSSERRMWVIDLSTHRVLFNSLVAHGQGSGEECASAFSNDNNSHQSSPGFYITGSTYQGEHGLSLKLVGMDVGFNDAAFDRGIVVHGANYVSERFIQDNQRLGRSWGCPAVPEELKEKIIKAIKDGTCLYINTHNNRYVQKSYWLNRKIEHLPVLDNFSNLLIPAANKKMVKYFIHYKGTNGADSVKELTTYVDR